VSRAVARVGGALATVTCALAAPVTSQAVALVGRVWAQDADAPISHAIVTLDRTRVAISDASGAVRFEGVVPGPHLVSVRSIGWRPVSISLIVPTGRTEIRFTANLRVLPLRLEPIEITAAAGVLRLAREGFFERRNLGFGHFVTRSEIVRRDPHQTSVLLVVLPPRFRRSCALWIDGVPVETLGDILRAVDLLLPPQTIAGLEIYSGGANTPVRFNVTRGRCSVVAWTR